MLFSPQIPLDLEPRRGGRFEDFVAGPNRTTVDAVRALPNNEDASLYLSGPGGSGKTHLLNAVCHQAREQGMTAFYLGLDRLSPQAEQALDGLEAMDLVCIDDLQRVAGQSAWEEALFHFINRLRASRGRLLVASRERLSAMPLELPDLASRLAWGLRLELSPLSDEDKLLVLQRYCEARGFELPSEVARYLIERGHRRMDRQLRAVDRIRHVAFTEKRQITVPLARRALKAG